MARTKAPEPVPQEEPKQPEPGVPTPSGPGIDERMAALREDHIAMGARDADDHYTPRA